MDEGIRARLKTPDVRELRNFGLVVSAGLAGVFGLLLPWVRRHPMPLWPFVLAVILTSAALLTPHILRYPHFVWNKAGRVLGWLNTQLILTLLFYLVFLPAGAIARAVGWDPMGKGFDHARDSYRRPCEHLAPKTMERPY